MKKNKHNGFLLAEAFIVSTFVLGVLVYLYIQTKVIINNYNKSASYNTIPGIYITKEIDKYFKYIYDDVKDELASKEYIDITAYDDMMEKFVVAADIKQIIVTLPSMDWDLFDLKNEDKEVDSKFAKYINWVSRNKNGNCNYIIITEFNDDTYASLKL